MLDASPAPAKRQNLRPAAGAAALFVLLTAPLGVSSRPLPAADEAREAAVVANMLATGDWRQNALGGEVLYEKPPFFYMAVAAAARAADGLSPFSARLPSVLFAALALLATARAGAALFSPRAGLAAMLLLASTYLFVVNAHNCLIDVALTGCVAAGFCAFIARASLGAPRWDAWFGLFTAGALLSKGLIGPILLVLLTLPFWRLSSERRPLRQSVSVGALVMPLAAFALWMGVAWSAWGAHGLYEVLWVHHVGRFLGFAEPGYEHHRAGFFFYLPLLPGLLFPWTLLVGGGLSRAFRPEGRRALRPLAVGFLLALLLLSVAGTKRTVYLLPLVPVAALLCAGYLEEALRHPTRGSRVLLGTQLAIAAAGLAAVVGLGLFPFSKTEPDQEAEFFREVELRVPPGAPFLAYNVNLDILGKAVIEMRRPPPEQYSVERALEACEKSGAFVLSEVEHLREPHVAPLRRALAPIYVGMAGDKVVALYRARRAADRPIP